MKQVIVNIPEKKFRFFMKLMKALDFVQVIEPAPKLEEQLTPAQMKTWKNIKQGFVELKMAEDGKLQFRPVQDLIDEL
jgi:hypothetical protein